MTTSNLISCTVLMKIPTFPRFPCISKYMRHVFPRTRFNLTCQIIENSQSALWPVNWCDGQRSRNCMVKHSAKPPCLAKPATMVSNDGKNCTTVSLSTISALSPNTTHVSPPNVLCSCLISAKPIQRNSCRSWSCQRQSMHEWIDPPVLSHSKSRRMLIKCWTIGQVISIPCWTSLKRPVIWSPKR